MYLEKLEDLYMHETDSMQKEIDILSVNEFDFLMAMIEMDYNIYGKILTIKRAKEKIKELRNNKESMYYRGVKIQIV